MDALYNEWDSFAAAWLRELIKAGHIPPGDVDERDIRTIPAADVMGRRTVHWFAGIGGWPYALKLAGWPADRPVWSASLPCQPFSCAGQRKGFDDERHLWPVFASLVAESMPATIIGEQVASADGREWLSRVRDDLEDMGYAVACADLCAAGVSAPHLRQRLFWVAHLGDSDSAGSLEGKPTSETSRHRSTIKSNGSSCLVGNASGERLAGWTCQPGNHEPQQPSVKRTGSVWDDYDIVACKDRTHGIVYRRVRSGTLPLANGVPARVGRLRGYGNSINPHVGALFVRAFIEANQ